MEMLALSALVFVGLHLGVAGTSLRDRLVGTVGQSAYTIGFSVASLISIVWVVKAYQGAPYVPTWGMLEWWKPVAIALMLPAFWLAVTGLTTPTPTAVGQDQSVDAPPQGIVRVTRHPFLVGVGLWALIHLVGNGDAASLVFFATWVVVAAAGPPSIDAKRRRSLGADRWDRFAAQTSILPFGAVLGGRTSLRAADLLTWRLLVSVLVYAVVLAGHARWFGVSPFTD